MSLRDALRIAWDDVEVEGYSMGRHTQMLRLRDVLAEVGASPRLPRDLPAWLTDLHERMACGTDVTSPVPPPNLDDLLAQATTTSLCTLGRAARLQAVGCGGWGCASTTAVAAGILLTSAISRRHALPIYRRVVSAEGSGAVAPPSLGVCGSALAVAERAHWATSAVQMLSDIRR